ncbi:MAG: thioredoxin family protein [Eubacteriales bacterium]|nr:thioredoxin family protein [Eubacteriales bacterium]
MKALNLSQSEFTQLTGDNKPVLVDFWAPWCTYCRRIGPAYDKLAEQMGEALTFAKVNIDEEPELARQEQIEVIPTLVLYRGGQALGSMVAPESKAKIEEFLEETLGK